MRMKIICFLGVVIFICIGFSSFSFGHFVDSAGIVCKDGVMPIPFSTNQKVELADGELYLLVGKFRDTTTSKPYFVVDFSFHPWLKNVARVKSPQYPLLGIFADEDFYHYEGLKVTVLVQAFGYIEWGSLGLPSYVISLLPLGKPMLFSGGRGN